MDWLFQEQELTLNEAVLWLLTHLTPGDGPMLRALIKWHRWEPCFFKDANPPEIVVDPYNSQGLLRTRKTRRVQFSV